MEERREEQILVGLQNKIKNIYVNFFKKEPEVVRFTDVYLCRQGYRAAASAGS